MSKYFDKLTKMNESLDAELHAKGIDVSTANRADNTNNASKNGENEIVLEEGDDDKMVPVPADSLTDEQKKKAIEQAASDAGLDKPKDETLNEIVKNPDSMKAVQDALGGDGQNESVDMSDDGDFVVRMDDDDLEMHGFVVDFSRHGIDLTDDEYDALTFHSREEAIAEVKKICRQNGYDPDTFEVIELDGQEDDGDDWVTLDPTDVTATTLAD